MPDIDSVIKQCKTLVEKHGLLFSGLIVALLATGVTFLLFRFPYNSDDVAAQSILHFWGEYGTFNTWLPPDTFLDKYPVLVLVELLNGDNRRGMIFLSSVLMILILIVGVYLFISWVKKQADPRDKIKQTVFAYLYPAYIFSLTFIFIYTLRNPNGRNMEIGLFFLLLTAFLQQFFKWKMNSTKEYILAISTGLGLGFLYFSDPYFLLFGPLFVMSITVLTWWVRTKINFRLAIVNLAVSVGSYVIFKLGFAGLGIRGYSLPIELPSITDIPARFLGMFDSIAYVFNLEFGGPSKVLFAGGVLSSLLALAIVVRAIYVVIKKIKTKKITVVDIVSAAMIIQIFAILGSYIVTQAVIDKTTSRYLVLIPVSVFVLAFTSGMSLHLTRKRAYVLAGISALAIILNIFGSARHLETVITKATGASPRSVSQNMHNKIDKDVVETLSNLNIQKGYSSYWDGNIVNYLSNYKLRVLPVVCLDDRLEPFYWVAQDRAFKDERTPSFIIFDNSFFPATGCKFEYLGEYTKEIGVGNGIMIRVYPYDIGREFKKREDFTKPY